MYSFFVGLFVGLPIGCYLREKGYAYKMMQAYNIFSPAGTNQKDIDLFRNKNQEFYSNLKRGQVDHKDFERYIYGGSYGKKGATDERDKIEDKLGAEMYQLTKKI